MSNETNTSNDPFVLVTDKDAKRIATRGYEKFILGPVTEADGHDAESNAIFLKDLLESFGTFQAAVLDQEGLAQHSGLPVQACMTDADLDVVFNILGPDRVN